jgi:hypothetical protein
MPIHRVPVSHIAEDLTQIQREGERILSITPEVRVPLFVEPDSDLNVADFYLVVTEFVTPGVETR